MQLEDFDKTQVLESGFREKEIEKKDTSKKTCIYCGVEVPCDSLRQHALMHTDQEKFDLLLHADSVFAFTAKEKLYLNYVFSGYKDKEIAPKMGIPEVSARRMRNQFNGPQLLIRLRLILTTKLVFPRILERRVSRQR